MRGFSAATALLFVAIALLPVGYALMRSVWGANGFSFDAYRTVLNEGRQWTLLRNSLAIAFGSTVAATVLGVLVGFSIEYIRVPARRALSYCVAVPFLVPPYISAVAWIDLLGENGILTVFLRKIPGIGASFPKLYSIPGVILVLALTHYPIVVLTTVLAIRQLDRRFEEAAQLVGKKSRVLLSITLPLLAPGILSGALFVFILALVSFSVPSLLQVDAYPVEIYSRFSAFYDFRGATAQALPLLLTGAVVLAGWAIYVRPRRAWLSGARRLRTLSSTVPAVRIVSAVCCWLLVALSAALPVAVLIRRSLPLTSYIEAWLTAREEIGTSILVAVGSATLLATLGFSIAYLTRRRRSGGGIYALSVLPFLLSGPVIGIGLILLWNHHGMRALVYDSLIVMVFACTSRFLFFAHQGTGAAMRDLHASLEEAASVAGVPWWRQVMSVLIPILRPWLFGVWALGFLFSLRELDATVLVCPPGSTTLPVRLFTLMHYGPSRIVAALSVITAFMILFGGALTATVYSKTRNVLDARYRVS
jgi:iron(III) transport system permease protein